MEYTDSHKKRTELEAESFVSETTAACRHIAFVGHGQHRLVNLTERGSNIIAFLPDADRELVLRKAQIFGKLKWLTLDFEENALLHRILIHIDHLDIDSLDSAIKSLIGTRQLFYSRR